MFINAITAENKCFYCIIKTHLWLLHSGFFFSKTFLGIMNLYDGSSELSKAYKIDYFNINLGFLVIR